jgi:hypothetical protein
VAAAVVVFMAPVVVVAEYRVRVDQVVAVTAENPGLSGLMVQQTQVAVAAVERLRRTMDSMAVKVLSSFATSINRRIIWLITQN